MAHEAPELDEDWSAGSWWPDGSASDPMQDCFVSAANMAAVQADIAAKNAQALAQWHDHLWRQIAGLQRKIQELEDWKEKTVDDMSRLRFEHQILRRQIGPAGLDDEPRLPSKAKSLPLMLADHVADTKQKKMPTMVPTLMRPPPGLEVLDKSGNSKQVRFADGAASASAAVPASPAVSSATSSTLIGTGDSTVFDDGPAEGLFVTETTVDGKPCHVAEWRIGNLSTKLKGCMGRALVSSPFGAFGLEDLRLMVFPDGKEPVKGPRSRRQKELYTKKVTDGPLEGCLKLKVPECPAPHIIEYCLYVGSVRSGPFTHNFGENTVNGCMDFGIDWLQQVEPDQSLLVKVEILAVPKA